MSAWPDVLEVFYQAICQGNSLDIPGVPEGKVRGALDIYRNNYRGNLQDAMAAAYPVIRQVVGVDFFRYAVRHYIAGHPSRNGDLHRYGARYPGFLSRFAPAASLPYLPDLARLEWLCHRAHFSLESGLFQGRLVSAHPVVTLWQTHQRENGDEISIDLSTGGEVAIVVRTSDPQVWVIHEREWVA